MDGCQRATKKLRRVSRCDDCAHCHSPIRESIVSIIVLDAISMLILMLMLIRVVDAGCCRLYLVHGGCGSADARSQVPGARQDNSRQQVAGSGIEVTGGSRPA